MQTVYCSASHYEISGAAAYLSLFSVYSCTYLGSNLSALDLAPPSSSISARGCAKGMGTFRLPVGAHGIAKLGSSISVLDFISLGSGVSLRGCARYGSGLSLYAIGRLGTSLTELVRTDFGATSSLKGLARMGPKLSLYGLAKLRMAVFFAGFCLAGLFHELSGFHEDRVTVSRDGMASLGSAISILDYISIGSSLYLRSFVRSSRLAPRTVSPVWVRSCRCLSPCTSGVVSRVSVSLFL